MRWNPYNKGEKSGRDVVPVGIMVRVGVGGTGAVVSRAVVIALLSFLQYANTKSKGHYFLSWNEWGWRMGTDLAVGARALVGVVVWHCDVGTD